MHRSPAVSGKFYPQGPGELRRDLKRFLPSHLSKADARAILVPHAGYLYSGEVAGLTFSSVKLPKTFLLLGPNHTGLGMRFSVMDRGWWDLSLGEVPIHQDLASSLLDRCPQASSDETAHRNEHSLEVQLPFLQFLLADFKFVPMCLMAGSFSELAGVGEGIAGVLADFPEPVMLIISSDMTHYESRESAEVKDRRAIQGIEEVDPEGLFRIIQRERISMCGWAAAVAGLVACRALGSRKGRLVRYATSGEVTGDFSEVVGYAGIVIN